MASTVYATVTTPGPPGPAGPAGYSPQFIVAAGVPGALTGNVGDMYIDSSTGNVYGPKTASGWGSVAANIKGPAGTPGTPGYSPLYIVAAGAPSNATGNNGDMYIDSTTSNVYGPKSAGAWGGIVCNIKGAPGTAGATGPQGPPGVAYTPMGAWSSTTTYAQGHEVTYGNQLYISLQSGNLNNTPSTSPTYWQALGTGASQTPWLSDIDASGYLLKNAGGIGVGIGVPQALLHTHAPAAGAQGGAVFTNGSSGSSASQGLFVGVGGGGADGYLWNYNNYSVQIGTNNTERVRITNTGFVGIGASVPQDRVQIRSATDTNLAIGTFGQSTGAGSTVISSFNDAASANQPIEIRATITTVGIPPAGTSRNVFGAIYGAPACMVVQSDNQTASLASKGPLTLVNSDGSSGNWSSLQFGTFGSNNNIYSNAFIAAQFVEPRGAGYCATDLVFATGVHAGPAERMRITNAGRVGIAASDPQEVLDISGLANDPNLGLYSGLFLVRGGRGVDLEIGAMASSPYGMWFQGRSHAPSASYPLHLQPVGGVVTIGNPANTTYNFNVTGDVNITGTYRVNGTPISGGGGGGLTTMNNVTGSRAVGGIYQNTAKPQWVTVCAVLNGSTTMIAASDASSNPGTTVADVSNLTGSAGGFSVGFWVMPNHYFKIVATAGSISSIVSWVEYY